MTLLKPFSEMIHCRNVLLICFIFFHFLPTSQLRAQDPRFTQSYAAPIHLNPALSGTYDGSFRISGIYRDQWRGTYNEPLQTYSVSGDVRFPVNKNVRGAGDAFSAGVLFLTDRMRVFDFNTTFITLNGAYHKLLNKKHHTYLSGGMKFSMVNRSVNFENMTFQDQFNGINAYIFDTKENLPFNTYTYPDLGLGLHYTTTPEEHTHFSVGIAMDHILNNNISFYRDEEVDPFQPKVETNLSIYKRYNAEVQYTFPISQKVQLNPRLSYLLQGPFQEANVGLIWRYKNIARNNFGVQLGGWIRGNNYNESINVSSGAVMFGVELGSLVFALSYEMNITQVRAVGSNRNAFEISATYVGNYSNDIIFCPAF